MAGLAEHDTPIDKGAFVQRLQRYVGAQDVADVLSSLPARSQVVLLYGSAARGDMTESSDIDLLIVAENAKVRSPIGRVNSNVYSADKMRAADRTIFGSHLKRDGIVLHGANAPVARAIHSFSDPDPQRVFDRVRELGVLLKSSAEERDRYLPGLLRLGRYLLRTALYAAALRDGAPCFSVAQLAARLQDPHLPDLLSSRQTLEVTDLNVFNELISRLEDVVGVLERNPYDSISALVVNEWEADPDLSNSALRALGGMDDDVDPYTDIPRIII